MLGQVRYRTKPRQSGIFWVQYRNADAGVSFLNADAHLWQLPGNMKKIIALSTLKHLLFKMAVKKEKNYKLLKFPSLLCKLYLKLTNKNQHRNMLSIFIF
jgi:hypothetical protein